MKGFWREEYCVPLVDLICAYAEAREKMRRLIDHSGKLPEGGRAEYALCSILAIECIHCT